MSRVSVREIQQELQRNQHLFSVPPVGPLGYHIMMNPAASREDMQRNIQIVQTVLGGGMFSYLVSSGRDQQTFKQIMQRRFGRVPPCIQLKYSDRKHVIERSPFINRRFNSADGPLVRVSDMFSIKDNNAWISNAILVYSNPENMYAHGTVTAARKLISSLDHRTQRRVYSLYTYRENNKLVRVMRKGGSVSGTPCHQQQPLLQQVSCPYTLCVFNVHYVASEFLIC